MALSLFVCFDFDLSFSFFLLIRFIFEIKEKLTRELLRCAELVVLGKALRTARRTGLDLTNTKYWRCQRLEQVGSDIFSMLPKANDEISNEGVFSFATSNEYSRKCIVLDLEKSKRQKSRSLPI